ncbi:MAG: hypothetical protein WCD49_15860 [Candidatus Acidiferrales bacterium]
MAQSREPENRDAPPPTLSERVIGYRQEVEKVVREVGEHPLYEFKRSCSLQNLSEKLEFVKDIQSIATSRIEREKFLVIGADAGTKQFCAVANAADFDEDLVRKLLDKYLTPVPDFEVFPLEASDGAAFVLIVIPKQKNRRIVAKATVYEPPPNGKLILREGDLWTKGGSTGKRLAKSEDWDEIFEELIEAETERRTKQRTAHVLEMAIAREKVQQGSGRSVIPSVFTDQEFEALMEEVCGSQDKARFSLLLERLRDDLVEGWHRISAYEDSTTHFIRSSDSSADYPEKVREHIKNVFRPAVHWLTVAGLFVVKNAGPIDFLNMVVDLLKEVYDASHSLVMLRAISNYGVTSATDEQHTSHTVPAVESLVSTHLIGGYIAKRNRFAYLKSLLRPDVQSEDRYGGLLTPRPLAFWPLTLLYGEHNDLRTTYGRLTYCLRRIETDSAYLRLFGSVSAATIGLCRYEFCLELNSYLAVCKDETPESVVYTQQFYPGMDFGFYPGFFIYGLESIHDLALRIFTDIKKKKRDFIDLLVFDPSFTGYLTKDGGDVVFLRFLKTLVSEQGRLYTEMRRFAPLHTWPKDLGDAMKLLPPK